MSIYTVCISRNLTQIEGLSNGRAVGDVIDLIAGDNVATYRARNIMKDIFYFKTVELTNEQLFTIKENIDDVSKHVYINTFTQEEKETLAIRGEVEAGLGGDLVYNSISTDNI